MDMGNTGFRWEKKFKSKQLSDVNDEHEPLYCKHVYLANNINFNKAKMLIDYFYFITRLIRKSCSLTKQNKKKQFEMVTVKTKRCFQSF
jgi:hypothetical protein